MEAKYTLEQIEVALENLDNEYRHNWTDIAYDSVHELLTRIRDEYLDEEVEVSEILWDILDNVFMYYSEAYEYLKEAQIWDISDAISEGFSQNLGSITYYYCEEEVYNLLREIGFEW